MPLHKSVGQSERLLPMNSPSVAPHPTYTRMVTRLHCKGCWFICQKVEWFHENTQQTTIQTKFWVFLVRLQCSSMKCFISICRSSATPDENRVRIAVHNLRSLPIGLPSQRIQPIVILTHHYITSCPSCPWDILDLMYLYMFWKNTTHRIIMCIAYII